MSTVPLDYKDLPISERIELVSDIWDSIAAEQQVPLTLSSEERAELQRRFAAHQTDPSTSISWDQVRSALFASRP
jgi:putative addiction module component (TIGR02574 family)